MTEIARMRRALIRYGERFVRHVFTEQEQQQAPGGTADAAYYAGRWAAKEAVAKALGTGIGRDCSWKDIQVRRDALGRPEILLEGAAARTAAKLAVRRVHVSISHERRMACACAIAEGEG